MPWNSVSPDGSISVKANRVKMNENTTYTEVTMGNSVVGTNTTSTRDHFWNVGSNEDGRHRFIQSPAFTVGAVAADPVIGTGMDGVQYLKSDGLTPARIEGFYRNSSGIYQHIPAFLSGSVAVNSSGTYSNVVAVPANCYGQIFMYTTALGKFSGVTGHFRSNATIVEAWGLTQSDDSTDTNVPLKFASGTDAVDLNLKARRSDAGAATWNYRITYRAF
jgi:hypothetical protein